MLSPLIAALAAGNTAVIKPSEVSANVSLLVAELIPKYLDMDAISIVMVGQDSASAPFLFDSFLLSGLPVHPQPYATP